MRQNRAWDAIPPRNRWRDWPRLSTTKKTKATITSDSPQRKTEKKGVLKLCFARPAACGARHFSCSSGSNGMRGIPCDGARAHIQILSSEFVEILVEFVEIPWWMPIFDSTIDGYHEHMPKTQKLRQILQQMSLYFLKCQSLQYVGFRVHGVGFKVQCVLFWFTV